MTLNKMVKPNQSLLFLLLFKNKFPSQLIISPKNGVVKVFSVRSLHSVNDQKSEKSWKIR